MLGKKRRKTLAVTKLSSLVAENMQIIGDIVFSGGLRVDGRICGNAQQVDGEQGLLVLSERGSVQGNVRVHDAVINGEIVGDLEVSHFLELQPSARVRGNIRYRQLQMDSGAVVEGQLLRLGDEGTSAKVVELPHPIVELPHPMVVKGG